MDYSNILKRFTGDAQDFINNPSRLDALLVDLEAKMKQIPVIGESVSELPIMIAMVKSWIKKECQVNVKVLATMIGAFLYVVNKNDLISDRIPVVGYVDDIAVLALALKFVKPDLEAYKASKGIR